MDDQRDEKTYRLSQVEAVIDALMSGSISRASFRSHLARFKSDKPLGQLQLEREEQKKEEIRKRHFRIRRMIELDRQHGLKVGEEKLAQYPMAFLDSANWGKGNPVRFTAYRACNIAIACDLQRLGFNQKAIVDALGQAAHSLKNAFENSVLAPSRRANMNPTQEPESPDDLRYFLLIDAIEAPKGTGKATGGRVTDGERIAEVEVVQGREGLWRRLSERYEERFQAVCVIEMSQLAKKMIELLSEEPEKTAGRPGKIK